MSLLDDAKSAFIESLYDATKGKVICWKINNDDDDRDVFEAMIDGDRLTVELLRLPAAEGAERCMVRLVGMKTWRTWAVGTKGYSMIMEMLAESTFGWKEGSAGTLKDLNRATDRVRALLAKHMP